MSRASSYSRCEVYADLLIICGAGPIHSRRAIQRGENNRGALEGHGKHVAVVVIRVFADKVDAAWCASDPYRPLAELSVERGFDLRKGSADVHLAILLLESP